HLRLVGLAVIGRHFDLVGAVDHVIVGDGKAVSGNEEAGALPGYRAMSARTTAQARGQAIRTAEAAEETLHRRTRLERRILIVIVLGRYLLVDVDLDRDDRRLHVLDDVGKADGLRGLVDIVADLRMRRAGEDVDGTLRTKSIHGDAEAGGDRGHQGDFAQGKNRTSARLVRRKQGKIGGAV